jgi:hypothetical protein
MRGLRWLPLMAAAIIALPATASAAPPANDNFASAQQLAGSQPIVVSGTTREATREPDDPSGLPPSVWYRWTPPASGRIAIEYCAQNRAAAEDLVVSVFTGGSRATLQYVGQEGNRYRTGDCPYGETGFALPEKYDVVAGTTYRIEVGGDPSMQGSFGLVVTKFVVPPANDDFGNAQVLSGSLPARAVGDPRDSDDGVLWYRWTAPTGGFFTLEHCFEGPSGRTSFDVFTGSSQPNLKRVPINSEYSHVSECPFDRGSHKELKDGVAFKATRGTTYVLRVAADPYETGRFGLALKRKEVYDLALRQKVSRRSVPAGGVVIVKLIVTNRGNITVPTRAEPRLFFGQSINKPAFRNDPGKGKYLSIRSPGARCSKGFFFKVPRAGCAVKRLKPGQKMVATMRIRVLASILLEADGNFGDKRRRNNEASVVVRAR